MELGILLAIARDRKLCLEDVQVEDGWVDASCSTRCLGLALWPPQAGVVDDACSVQHCRL